MKKLIILVSMIIWGFSAVAQTSPLKMVNFHKLPNEIADLKALKDEAGRDCDYDGNKAALIRVKAQGFSEKTMLDFNTFPRPGIEIIHKKYKDGEMWLYVSSGCQGTIVIKYMGEFEFKLPSKLDAKGVYELVLSMETATLVIRTVPLDADIYIDNEKVGKGEAIKPVSIGSEHRYRVTCNDYYTKEGVVKFDKKDEKVENVELEPSFGFITIISDPEGADILVDGKKVGTTPYMYERISRGQHRIEVKKEKYTPYVNVVNVKNGETAQLENVKLTAVRVPMGSLDLSSNPTGAVITINGRQYGQTPKTLTDFEVGTYTIYFSKEGYENLTQTVTVKDGKKETLNVTMSKTSVVQPPVQSVSSSQMTPTTSSSGNRTFTVNGVTFEMVAVKGGTFTMGSTDQYADSDEKITHRVTVSDFMIGKFEVTQKLWKAVMGNNPSYFKGDNLPVESVSWNDVQEFIRKLNQMTGQNFRLPTEAEWEYAARGGTNTSLYNGENINIKGANNSPNLDKLAWYGGNCGQNYTASAGCDVSKGYDISEWNEKQYNDSKGGTHPVGLKQPNAYGLYDILGNVWEWCQDWYGDYSSGRQTNPTGPSSGSLRVCRGGSWGYYAKYCRVSYRYNYSPDIRSYDFGFRLATGQ